MAVATAMEGDMGAEAWSVAEASVDIACDATGEIACWATKAALALAKVCGFSLTTVVGADDTARKGAGAAAMVTVTGTSVLVGLVEIRWKPTSRT